MNSTVLATTTKEKLILRRIFTASLLLGAAFAFDQPAVADDTLRIGFLTDMSGAYADLHGKNGSIAIQMEIDDFGGKINGMPIELRDRPEIGGTTTRVLRSACCVAGRGQRMKWVLRLVGAGVDGQSQNFEVMEISRPDSVGDIAAVLAAHTNTHGIPFDRPDVVARAQPVLEAAGVARRCAVVGGSFCETIPEGGDAYLLNISCTIGTMPPRSRSWQHADGSFVQKEGF